VHNPSAHQVLPLQQDGGIVSHEAHLDDRNRRLRRHLPKGVLIWHVRGDATLMPTQPRCLLILRVEAIYQTVFLLRNGALLGTSYPTS